MSFELIEAEKGNYPRALMCRALGLSRSGHHAFRTRAPSQRELDEQQLEVLMAAIILHLFSRKVVGWSIGDRLDAGLSGEALRSPIGRRQPRPALISTPR